MMLARLLALAISLSLLGASLARSQEERKSKPDISLEESKRISPFPPKSVHVDLKDGQATIRWPKVASQKIVCYEIYRSVDDGPMQKLGTAKEPPYLDNPPASARISYAVASVDANGNESRQRRAQPK